MADSESREIELSPGKVVVIREMTMTESIMADGFAMKFAKKLGEEFPDGSIFAKVYAVCSVRKFNGVDTNPVVSFAAFTSFSEKLNTREGVMLSTALNELMGGPTAEEIAAEVAAKKAGDTTDAGAANSKND